MKKAVLSIAMFAAFSGAAVSAPISVGPVAVPGNAFLTGVTASNVNQVYYFNIASAAGGLAASYNSIPVDNSLTGKFYTSNAGGSLLTELASFGSAVNGNVVLSYGAITAGYYAFQFTSSNPTSTLYSGQVITYVPAPAVLGLAGLGLVGLGLFSRRRAV